MYLKSAGSFDAAEETERDTLICDENGFAQTKDMPYGIYTVHQTSGWDGRELMKDFDVFICKDSQTYRYLINNANFESYIKIVKKDIETGKFNLGFAVVGVLDDGNIAFDNLLVYVVLDRIIFHGVKLWLCAYMVYGRV